MQAARSAAEILAQAKDTAARASQTLDRGREAGTVASEALSRARRAEVWAEAAIGRTREVDTTNGAATVPGPPASGSATPAAKHRNDPVWRLDALEQLRAVRRQLEDGHANFSRAANGSGDGRGDPGAHQRNENGR